MKQLSSIRKIRQSYVVTFVKILKYFVSITVINVNKDIRKTNYFSFYPKFFDYFSMTVTPNSISMCLF